MLDGRIYLKPEEFEKLNVFLDIKQTLCSSDYWKARRDAHASIHIDARAIGRRIDE